VTEPKPIRVSEGRIRGTAEDDLTVYRGVPFAAPPVGGLRWRPPEAAAAWSDVRDAGTFAPPAIGNGPTSSEDCLYLNVWSPAKEATDRLPVVVWIYGGGFSFGDTSTPLYSGENFAKTGVVFVSIAYRVGPLGFLAHLSLSEESPHGVSGNYGLLDQIAALKWVQKNIQAFGGDPERVTIFGESAGGISVSMLAASPLARDLFHGAISQSGGSFGPTRSPPLPGENTQRLKDAEAAGAAWAERLGARTAAELRALPAEKVSEAARGPPGTAWPIVDGWVIADDQHRLYERGAYSDTPILIGINSDEGAMFVAATDLSGYQASVRARYGRFADKLLDAYPADSDESAVQAARDLTRDAAFGWHNWTWARLQAQTAKSKVFYYYFDQRPPYSPTGAYAGVKGAPHASEIAFVFGHLDQLPIRWRDEDRAISEVMGSYWTNFVKTVDPNSAGVPHWPCFAVANPTLMLFRQTPQARPVPNPEQLEVLDGYFAWRRSPEGGM